MYATGQYDYQMLQRLISIDNYFADFMAFIDEISPVIFFGLILLGFYVFIRVFTVFRGK